MAAGGNHGKTKPPVAPAVDSESDDDWGKGKKGKGGKGGGKKAKAKAKAAQTPPPPNRSGKGKKARTCAHGHRISCNPILSLLVSACGRTNRQLRPA